MVTFTPGLSIGEIAARTGVGVPVLRSWEARYGFPAPTRGAGGHRRYVEEDCARVERVQRARAGGLSLEAAIRQVQREVHPLDESIFAGVRHRFPTLPVQRLSKRAMLAISRAIEDEACARAAHGVTIGFFQEPRFYRQSQAQWSELARTSAVSIVFAAFRRRRAPRHGPLEVPLSADAPMRREWAIVCDAPRFAACLAGWEVPGSNREFEATWTTLPAVAQLATEIALQLATRDQPTFTPKFERTGGIDDGLAATVALTNRVVAYLDRMPTSAR
jgi:DNA-binding transcriptional MerR regulator